MKINTTQWLTDDFGIYKFKSGLTGRVLFISVFGKTLQARCGPCFYSRLQCKKSLRKII